MGNGRESPMEYSVQQQPARKGTQQAQGQLKEGRELDSRDISLKKTKDSSKTHGVDLCE